MTSSLKTLETLSQLFGTTANMQYQLLPQALPHGVQHSQEKQLSTVLQVAECHNLFGSKLQHGLFWLAQLLKERLWHS